MAYAVIQSNHNNSVSTIATPGAVTAGNLLISGINVGDGSAITSVTDGSSNAWTQINTDVHDAGNGQLFLLLKAQGVAGFGGAAPCPYCAASATASRCYRPADTASRADPVGREGDRTATAGGGDQPGVLDFTHRAAGKVSEVAPQRAEERPGLPSAARF